jgi:hypothetical protein
MVPGGTTDSITPPASPEASERRTPAAASVEHRTAKPAAVTTLQRGELRAQANQRRPGCGRINSLRRDDCTHPHQTFQQFAPPHVLPSKVSAGLQRTR